MDKGYLVVFDDAENYKAKAYDIDSDVKEDDAKKLAIEDYTFYKFIEDNKVIYFTDKKIWNTYLKKLLGNNKVQLYKYITWKQSI